MKLTHIVARSENNTIGASGQLPWHLPEDLKFFKRTTQGHPIVMGRKTWESIGRLLPGRLNIVITRQENYRPEGVLAFSSIGEAIEYCESVVDEWGEEVFIIGGGEIYRQSMDLVDCIYMTTVHRKVEGDTFYPDVDFSSFSVKSEQSFSDPMAYTFQTLVRIS